MQILWEAAGGPGAKADLGSPDLLFGKAFWVTLPGAVLLSCTVCVSRLILQPHVWL